MTSKGVLTVRDAYFVINYSLKAINENDLTRLVSARRKLEMMTSFGVDAAKKELGVHIDLRRLENIIEHIETDQVTERDQQYLEKREEIYRPKKTKAKNEPKEQKQGYQLKPRYPPPPN